MATATIQGKNKNTLKIKNMTMKINYLIVVLSIICVNTFAQEMYEITPEIAKKISQGTDYTYGTDFNLFNAEYQDVELAVSDTTLVTEDYKEPKFTKNILLKLDPVTEYENIVGEFKMISDNNYCIIEAQKGFVQNQIISVDEVIKNKLDQYVEGYYSYSSYLFENIKTKKLYYGESKFFSFCDQEYKMIVAVKKISDLGYGVSQVGNDIYINTKSIKLLFTNDIYKNLKTDKEYINRLASSVSSYLKYSEQFMPLTTELANYYQKWRIGTIDNTGIQEWKSVIQKAQNLNEKLKNLEFNTIDNSYNYNKQLPSSVINNKLNFYTILNKSIELMGQ